MLVVDVRRLHDGPVLTQATLSPEDAARVGLDLSFAGPLAVDGRLQSTGEGEYFWHATVQGRLLAECRRCLERVPVTLEAEIRVLFSTDPDAADDPGVYPLAESASQVNLGQAVREELLLAAPAYVLCREDCAGLCPQCGADLNAGPCGCSDPA